MAEDVKKRSVVIAEGTYNLDRRKVLLRSSLPFKAAEPPEKSMEEAAAEAAAAATAAEAALNPQPTPEELARQAAEEMLGEARREAESLKRQAREQGYAEGLKEGVEQGKAQGRGEALSELRETLERWLTMGDALSEAWRARFDGLDDEVRDLAVASAERLVERQLELTPDAVMGVIRDSLRHAAEAESVTLLVAPKDVALVRGAKEELAGLLKGTGRFDISEDPKVAQGGCLVVTKTQLIDSTRKTRTDIIRDSMRKNKDEHAD